MIEALVLLTVVVIVLSWICVKQNIMIDRLSDKYLAAASKLDPIDLEEPEIIICDPLDRWQDD